MPEEQTFDPSSFIENYSTPDSLPELRPSKTTFYFPATPEDTKKAGLSYRMEGGIHGGPGFSDIDLRNHTLEKYDAGESKFVAVAMAGVPSGEYFRMQFPDGTVRTIRNIDTGGGLVRGQADIATSNPDLARGGGRTEYVTAEIPRTQLPGVSEEEIDAIVGKKKGEEPPQPSKAGGRRASAFIPTPIPEYPLAQVRVPPFEAEPQPIGTVGQIPKTEIPSVAAPPIPSALQPQPLPMPTPEFPTSVQEAIDQGPRFASEPFNPQAFVNHYAINVPQQLRTPTPTPTPTPPTFNPQAFVAQYASPTELPPPQIGQKTPSGIGQFVQGLGQSGVELAKGLIPKTENIRAFGTTMAAPLYPEDFLKQTLRQAIGDVTMVREARKAGPLSKAAGRLTGHALARLVSLTPALRVGTMTRIAREAPPIPKPPIQTRIPSENAVAGRVEPEMTLPEAQPEVVTSRLANRFIPERQAAGELGQVAPDAPVIKADLMAAASRMAPEEIAQQISNLVHNQGGSFLQQAAAVSVEEARLSNVASQLSKVARQNPTPENILAAENAFKNVTDFHNGPVTKMKGIWSAGGKVMQGDTPIDLASLNGQREAWLRDVGKAPPPEADPILQRLADNMFKANQDMVRLQQAWRADAQSLNPKVTPEMVREQILAKLKKMTPC